MRVLGLVSGLSDTRAALVAVVTGVAWHIWYAWLEIMCRIDLTRYGCCRLSGIGGSKSVIFQTVLEHCMLLSRASLQAE